MKLIVGLGNPGPKYESTRHNVGFQVVDHLLKDLEPVEKSNWDKSDKFKSEIYLLEYQPKVGKFEKVILAKPQTYMNRSGEAVSKIAKFYKIKSKDIWIIHDELDLPLETMKIRFGGSGAGHHGVESVIEALKTDNFWRFRMGIGAKKSRFEKIKKKIKGGEMVLRDFRGNEASKVRTMTKKASKALQNGLEKGIESSQNQFNTK